MSTTACEFQFPMWVVPIDVVLSMDRVESHQVLKAKGLLVEHRLADQGPVIFVSHQWLSTTHPDPDGNQFKVLQKALRRLLSGESVRSHWRSGMLPQKRDYVVSNWPELLKNSKIWYDYMSVPQLTNRVSDTTVNSPEIPSTSHSLSPPLSPSSHSAAPKKNTHGPSMVPSSAFAPYQHCVVTPVAASSPEPASTTKSSTMPSCLSAFATFWPLNWKRLLGRAPKTEIVVAQHVPSPCRNPQRRHYIGTRSCASNRSAAGEEEAFFDRFEEINVQEDLERAVRSIPAYVELCSFMFVLCPPLEHLEFKDDNGDPLLCDYSSWTSRGWCILERTAQFLKVNCKPAVVIPTEKCMYFQDIVEGAYRQVGAANFTCCAMNHRIYTDANSKPIGLQCDKFKVQDVLDRLVARRLTYELGKSNLRMYRQLRSMCPYFSDGLPTMAECSRSTSMENATPPGMGTISDPASHLTSIEDPGAQTHFPSLVPGSDGEDTASCASAPPGGASASRADTRWAPLEFAFNLLDGHLQEDTTTPRDRDMQPAPESPKSAPKTRRRSVEYNIDRGLSRRSVRHSTEPSNGLKRNIGGHLTTDDFHWWEDGASSLRRSLSTEALPGDNVANTAEELFHLSGHEVDMERWSLSSGADKERDPLEEFLLENKFDSARTSDGGWTPLRFAAISGNIAVVKQLLELKVDIEAPLERADPHWALPPRLNILTHAAMMCYDSNGEDVLDLLLEAKAMPESGGVDILTMTSLMPMRPKSKNWGAEWLLRRFPNWDVDSTCQGKRNSPAFRAHNGVAQDRVKRIDGWMDAVHQRVGWQPSWPALLGVHYSDNLSYLQMLVSHGADLRKVYTVTNGTIFMASCGSFASSSVEGPAYVLRNVPDLDLDRRVCIPWPLYWTVKVLVKLGNRRAWFNALLCWHNATAIYGAASEGKHRVVAWLLEQKADPNIHNGEGETPLAVAHRLGFSNVVDVLKASGVEAQRG
eukprot:GEMP01001436.1.p1 GENE.GEMP01001436.1~~GEMP01001436.1.p1  ORF type:complete len:979 (+),score=217.72 GEMP01001436.1:192-3128(+)